MRLFLSCLPGSEVNAIDKNAADYFLSCLSGSEALLFWLFVT